MGAGASFETGIILQDDSHSPSFVCHSCFHMFRFSTIENSERLCPNCQSSFLEQLDHGMSNRRSVETDMNRHGQLTFEQARRITNATAMLRLLESQLREELEHLQLAFEAANQRISESQQEKKKTLTKIMKGKLRNCCISLDMVCSQPSCPICSEDYVVGADSLKLPCSHFFHKTCVMPWLEVKQTCPICRGEMSDEVPSITEILAYSVEEIDETFQNIGVEVPDIASRDKKELATLLNSKLAQYKDEQIQSEAVVEILNIQTIRLPFLTFAIGRDDSSEMNSINDNIS